jgi:hypothetical protein
MIPSAPKFRKIILILKDKEGKPSEKVEYLDSAMVITGNYVIVTEEKEVSINEASTIDGKIYDMGNIHSYKLFKN